MSWLIKINPFAWLAPSQNRQGYHERHRQKGEQTKGNKQNISIKKNAKK